MLNRIIDFTDSGAYLKAKLCNLIVERKGEQIASIPFEDIAVVVIANQRVVMTSSVAAEIAENNGIIVFCNSRKLPISMTLPLSGNCIQTERFAKQAEASKPKQNQMWKTVIKAKIRAQARVLEYFHDSDFGLATMAKKVTSGDKENREGQAARKYWNVLFPDKKFKRDRYAEDINIILNYGYTVLRAIVARAVVSAGLHPSIGIFHHNRFDTFVLADDLMEPFRPLVDWVVAAYYSNIPDHKIELGPKEKQYLISSISGRYKCDREERNLFDWLNILCTSAVKVYMGEASHLNIPELGPQ